MLQYSLSEVLGRISQAIDTGDIALADQLLFPALDQFPDYAVLWHYAGVVLLQQGRVAPAVECWQKSYALEANPQVLSNIGSGLRQMQRPDLGRKWLERALLYRPTDDSILSNLCGCYVNEGNPVPGIEYGERALAQGGEHARTAQFNMALLYLESGQLVPGFDHYAEGFHRWRDRDRLYYGGENEPPLLTPDRHAELKGRGNTLIVYGEQGIGDEILFSTILEDAARDYDIVFDCHPRLEWLHRHSAWAEALRDIGKPARIFPTRKSDDATWAKDHHVKAAAKVPIGNLARLYRRDGFPWRGPVLRAPMEESDEYREQLEMLAEGRPIVGLAMRGGTLSTNRHYRGVSLKDLQPLLEQDYLFVSLDYEDMTETVQWFEQNHPGKFFWYPSVLWHWDYHHTAALVAALDAVVSVAQSVCHLAAAMAHPLHMLVSSKPAWREGPVGAPSGEKWFLYPSGQAIVHRQQGGDWSPAIDSVCASLRASLAENRSGPGSETDRGDAPLERTA